MMVMSPRDAPHVPARRSVILLTAGSATYLGVAVVRIAPSAAFKEAVARSNSANGTPARKIAAMINTTARKLTNIQSTPTRVQVTTRTVATAIAAHEQHFCAMRFKVIDISLKPGCVHGAQAG